MTSTLIGWLVVALAFCLTYGFLYGCQWLGSWVEQRWPTPRTIRDEPTPPCSDHAETPREESSSTGHRLSHSGRS
jgi:hypothetical protein